MQVAGQRQLPSCAMRHWNMIFDGPSCLDRMQRCLSGQTGALRQTVMMSAGRQGNSIHPNPSSVRPGYLNPLCCTRGRGHSLVQRGIDSRRLEKRLLVPCPLRLAEEGAKMVRALRVFASTTELALHNNNPQITTIATAITLLFSPNMPPHLER